MATADRYSRLVLWLKVALPLAALGILSTLFFVAETLDPEAAIPYANVDVDRVLREQGVTEPSFGGIAANGIAISLFAASIRPSDQGNTFNASSLAASLNLPSGTDINVTSPSGVVDAQNQIATLSGGAFFETTTGYKVETEKVVASMKDGMVHAPQDVVANGPPGQIEAGQMELIRNDDTEDTFLLVFKGGVQLLYNPDSVKD